MLKKVKEYAAKWNMIENGDKVIVGVSGGADSVCLLFVLLELQKDISFEIIVVHVNHGLRGSSADADEAYVKELCKEHNILCVTYFENVELIAKNRKQSTEEAGRDVRREAFMRTMETYGGTKIALAHHKNDNVETFFMNLSRGTGLKGLCGIQPVAGKMIRPLLCLERKEIEAFLKKEQIEFCVDESNYGDEYTRNRIRNHVIPYLEKEVNSATVLHINETIEQLIEIQSFLEAEKNSYMEKYIKKEEQGWLISDKLPEISSALQSMILKEVLVKAAGKEKDISSVHLDAVFDLFSKQVGRKRNLPYALEAVRTYEGIFICKKKDKNSKIEEIKISLKKKEEQTILLKNMKIKCKILENIPGICMQNGSAKYFDYDIMKNRLSIRTRQPGDYITIHPDGRTQKLKAYFINEKIPQEQRDDILLAADGNHILWIIGFRTNCMYQVNENTKRVLEIQIDEGENHGRDN